MALSADSVEDALETCEGATKTAEGTDVCAATVEQGKRQVKPETAAFRASFTQAAALHAIADLVGLSCSNIRQNTIIHDGVHKVTSWPSCKLDICCLYAWGS